MAKSNRFMISFPVNENTESKERRFVFYDDYFGTGMQKFKFEPQQNIPKLK